MMDFHTVNVAGSQVWVTKEVRREIESWFRELKWPDDCYSSITIEDIYGSEVTIVSGALNYIYESTAEARAKSKAHDKEINADEVPGVD